MNTQNHQSQGFQGQAFQRPQPPIIDATFSPRGTGAMRALGFVRAMTGKAVILAAIVFGFQAAMPEGRRPSDLLGSFHGSTESAEMDAKRLAQVQTARETANAQAAAPVMAESLKTQADLANTADLICIGGGILGALFGADAKDLAALASQACQGGDNIRRNMTRTLTQSAH